LVTTKLPVAKTAPRQKLLAELTRNHNTKEKNSKNSRVRLTAPPNPHGVARPYAIILWRTPAKLAGDLALSLLNTPVEAHRAIFIIFNE
jgi:hypothetical protein